jgi:hypothetical protein
VTLDKVQKAVFSDGLSLELNTNSSSSSLALIATAFGSNNIASNVTKYYPQFVAAFDQGQSMVQVANLIESQGLIENLLGITSANTLSNDKVWVDFLYKNVVGVDPDTNSETSFANMLFSGMARGALLAQAAQVGGALQNENTFLTLAGISPNTLFYHAI